MRHHAGDDRQLLLAVRNGVLVRADLDQVEELAALVLNRIGADLLEIGLKPPVDGKIVRGNLDHRLLPRWRKATSADDPGLDQQSIVKRHNFHDCFAGLTIAATVLM